MANQFPYLPDIMQEVVERVDDRMFAKPVDPFHVFFDKGLYAQVGRSVRDNPDNFPLVWLIMNFRTKRGDYSVFGDVTCDLSISVPTDQNYTQQQREDISFHPKLFPIYEAFIEEVANEPMFEIQSKLSVKHEQIIRPYWGGSVKTDGTKNLWDEIYADEVYIKDLKFKLKFNIDCLKRPY
jgi:hypothetical protein